MWTRAVAALASAVLIAGTLAACSPKDPEASAKAMEERMRDIEKKMKDSMPKTQQIAFAQQIDPAVLKKVQEQLAVLKEYLDTPSGKMDMVTVNAIEAFQHREGMKEDGLLTEEVLKRLEAAAQKASGGASQG